LVEDLKASRGFHVVSAESVTTETLNLQILEVAKPEPEYYEKAPVFSVIIPVYNEADIVVKNIGILRNLLQKEDYELIACDDCSKDGTYDKLKDFAPNARDLNIQVLRSTNWVGKGGTIKNAVEKALGEIVIIMDIDLSADLRCIPALIREAYDSGGVVIGERSTSDRYTQGYFRVILSLAYNLLVRFLFKTDVRDHQCGFKAMKTDVARKLVAETRNNGFVFDTELIVLARSLGIPVRRIPVKWRDARPRKSNLKWVKASFTMMKELIMLKLSGTKKRDFPTPQFPNQIYPSMPLNEQQA
jgi:glycosyltransferase involved in cell wall biosynthesis